jgi:TDG/mug DNA glycosylase family protein
MDTAMRLKSEPPCLPLVLSLCLLVTMSRHKKPSAVCTSFPPIAAADARVLVLGTMPSVASLAKRQYYGHPQNAFWRIMGRLFGAGLEVPYEERKAILCEAGVAVWDVLAECDRPGSLDTSIRRESEVVNDFATFFRDQSHIRTVFFNGQKSESLFRRHAMADLAAIARPIEFIRLPSTSPAHAGRSLEDKLAEWQAVKRAARRRR